ncbi:winged helix-turn-helix transcriptional regulator [Nitrosomonas oligotropha]|uniref:winged helix-turn-helix transcriptional regulator n=1 Tax=Nitrosomonas oligotropha TaxID=42354 RepID=UPI00136D8723|nr:helix-turn-helix domain-containing protein [Nitrosomonas oligotropha]MXS81805.1 transcriptional regulator [Nitrosomonas oligotropha]
MADDLNQTEFERSCCPVACALDNLGDKWTLLLVRDFLLGKKRYQEFLTSPEQIATNILADRLKKLEAAGIIVQHAYQQKPLRYEYVLTQKGEDLRPVLEALVKWGMTYYPGTKVFKPYAQRSATTEKNA